MSGGLPALPKPKLQIELGNVFTKKEADELLPRFKSSLKTVWKLSDKTVQFTNREMAEPKIWRSIDDEETEIIAKHLIDMGLQSRLAATAIRKVTNAHRMLEIGAITGPRFLLSFKWMKDHGGFNLPWQLIFGGGKGNGNPVPSERAQIRA